MDEELFTETQETPEPPEMNIQQPETFSMALNLEGEMPEPEQPKKSGKKLWVRITALVLAVVMLLVGVLGFALLDWGLYIRDFWERMKSPEDYKNIVEARAITEGGLSELSIGKEQLLRYYTDARDLAQKGGQEVTVTVKMDDTLRRILSLALTGDRQTQETVKALSDVTLTIRQNRGADALDASVRLDNSKATVTLDVYLDAQAKMFYLTIPDFNEKAYEMDISDHPQLLELAYAYLLNRQTDEFLKNCPDPQAAEALLEEYLVLAVEQITDVEREKEKITAGGVAQKVTVLTYQITDKTAKDAAIALLRKAKNDKTAGEILDAYNQMATNVNAIYDEMEAAGLTPGDRLPTGSFDELLQQAEAEETTGERLLTVNTYVNKKGQIVGRSYTNEDVQLSYMVAVKGFNAGVAVTLEGEQLNVDAQVTTRYRKGSLSGEGSVLVNEKEYARITVTELGLKTATGTIRLSPGKDLRTLLGDKVSIVDALLDIDQLGLVIVRQEEGLDLTLELNKSTLLHLQMGKENHQVDKLTPPENTAKRVVGWGLTTDWNAVKQTLEAFGLDQFLTTDFLTDLLDALTAGKKSETV